MKMPVAVEEAQSGFDALDIVCEALNSPEFESAVKTKESDLDFLSDFLNGTVIQSLVETHDVLEEAEFAPVSCDTIDTVQEIIEDIDSSASRNPSVVELKRLLTSPHFKGLVLAHDDVAAKNYDETLEEGVAPAVVAPVPVETFPGLVAPTDAIRMVGIRKNAEEPLGITVRKEVEGLVIARILTGSMIERQGLLHVGDVIKEINGQEVSDPDTLMEIMKKTAGSVTLKILPSYFDQNAFSQVYLRAHFAYNPKRDNLIPCRDAGLAFKEGDILLIVNMDDPNWWQAKKVDKNGPSGLIPSQHLEENRKAFVKPENDFTHKSLLCGLMTKKKRKMMYQATRNSEFDRNDLMIYEEVARMPPFQRKTLVLIGAQGVGRRTLKRKLIKADETRFGQVVPHTSRPKKDDEVNGKVYWFASQDEIERDIALGKYLEWGQHDGHVYGTKYDAVRHVVRSGRMCILDVNPHALKAIKSAEFMPYVVFIAAAPTEIMRNMHEYARQRGRTDKFKTERDFQQTLKESQNIERQNQAFFDLKIVNDNMDDTYNKLRKAIETLSTEPQWVPVSWVY